MENAENGKSTFSTMGTVVQAHCVRVSERDCRKGWKQSSSGKKEVRPGADLPKA